MEKLIAHFNILFTHVCENVPFIGKRCFANQSSLEEFDDSVIREDSFHWPSDLNGWRWENPDNVTPEIESRPSVETDCFIYEVPEDGGD